MSARRKPAVEPTDALEAMLTRLQLTAIRDQLDTLLDQATRSELTLREALAMLCQAEVARKDERRIQMGLLIAKFPFVRKLDGFDHEAQPSADPKQLRELATSRWIANGESVLLLGPLGVGKTHLAVALGREAILLGLQHPLRSGDEPRHAARTRASREPTRGQASLGCAGECV